MKIKLVIGLVAITASLNQPVFAADAAAKTGASAAHLQIDFTLLNAIDVKAGIDAKKQQYLFDANGSESYAKNHLPGAVWVQYDKLELALLPADKKATLVFYCANERCLASHEAAKQALAMGYTSVNVMPQGIQGWVKAGYPVQAAHM
jgi:rhodanese-related sulfurtransferase